MLMAGDIFPVRDHSAQAQEEFARVELADYLESLSYSEIIIVAGNHDFMCYDFPTTWFWNLPKNVTYLQDAPRIVDGVKIWGSPWSPKFGGWAFMRTDDELEGIYGDIFKPEDIDIMVSHGPPYMACDRNIEGESCGSLALRDWILVNQPKLVVTGHIHEAYGSTRIKDTDVFNVSRMNRHYEPVNKAVTYEI